MEEKHDTSRNIIIAIIVIAIIAVLGYFIYTSTLDNDEEAITNEVEDMVDDATDNNNDNEFDEVGAYTGMETYGDEEATATIELVLNDDNTATLVLAYDETSEYSGTYTKDGDNITFTADNEEETTTDNSVIDDTNDSVGTTTENTDNTTFSFTVKDDNLYYTSKETNEDVMLDKVDRDTLQYIEK